LPILSAAVGAVMSYSFGPFTKANTSDILIAGCLGIMYILSELPNSFTKRRLGIKSGSVGTNKRLQLIIDKTDSLIGICIFYFLVVDISVIGLLIIFLISLLTHLALSYLLVLIGLKKSI